MPFPAANWTVTVRGRRSNHNYFARDIEVQIFATQMMPILNPELSGMPQFRYGMHWDLEDTLDDGTANGSPIREGDILLWPDQYPNQELALSAVTYARASVDDDFVLPTAYFMPVQMGQAAQ